MLKNEIRKSIRKSGPKNKSSQLVKRVVWVMRLE